MPLPGRPYWTWDTRWAVPDPSAIKWVSTDRGGDAAEEDRWRELMGVDNIDGPVVVMDRADRPVVEERLGNLVVAQVAAQEAGVERIVRTARSYLRRCGPFTVFELLASAGESIPGLAVASCATSRLVLRAAVLARALEQAGFLTKSHADNEPIWYLRYGPYPGR